MSAELLRAVERLAVQAGEVILPHFAARVRYVSKADGSPVTLADEAADVCIRQALSRLTPAVPVLTEETADAIAHSDRLGWQRLWLVDPLDGTRQFIRGDVGFSVNIALVEAGVPVLGVVYAPAMGIGYGAWRGGGAWCWQSGNEERQRLSTVTAADPLRVLTGFSATRRGVMTQTFLAALGNHQLQELGSAIKICRVAEGSADVYPRFGMTSEWDTAAAQLVLEEAGGALVDVEGQPLTYNQRDILTNPPFIAVGDSNYPWPLAAVRQVMSV